MLYCEIFEWLLEAPFGFLMSRNRIYSKLTSNIERSAQFAQLYITLFLVFCNKIDDLELVPIHIIFENSAQIWKSVFYPSHMVNFKGPARWTPFCYTSWYLVGPETLVFRSAVSGDQVSRYWKEKIGYCQSASIQAKFGKRLALKTTRAKEYQTLDKTDGDMWSGGLCKLD